MMNSWPHNDHLTRWYWITLLSWSRHITVRNQPRIDTFNHLPVTRLNTLHHFLPVIKNYIMISSCNPYTSGQWQSWHWGWIYANTESSISYIYLLKTCFRLMLFSKHSKIEKLVVEKSQLKPHQTSCTNYLSHLDPLYSIPFYFRSQRGKKLCYWVWHNLWLFMHPVLNTRVLNKYYNCEKPFYACVCLSVLLFAPAWPGNRLCAPTWVKESWLPSLSLGERQRC